MRLAVAAKVALLALLALGTAFPHLEQFEGKGMGFRLVAFMVPALAVPALRAVRRDRRPYPVALDLALTLPFLFDTIGNAAGAYNAFDATDDVLHFVNWVTLCGFLARHLAATRVALAGAATTWGLATGIGALAIIGWEVAEYLVAEAGVGGLRLTYGDTVADLALSCTGGALGAALAVATSGPRRVAARDPGVPADATGARAAG